MFSQKHVQAISTNWHHFVVTYEVYFSEIIEIETLRKADLTLFHRVQSIAN